VGVKRLLPLLAALPLAAAQPAHFEEHTIATGLRGGYQVVVADLNHDGKPDLIALASGLPELVWYENPTWERHVIVSGQSRMINCAVTPDGEIVLASEFSNNARQSAGVVSVLHRNGDPRQPWSIREIDRLPTSHRLRVARIAGETVVVNAPLTAADAEPPDYHGFNPLVYYRPGDWKRRLIGDDNNGLIHGILVTDWGRGGPDEILTAGFNGIHVYGPASKAGGWRWDEVVKGDPAPWPKSGSSDVAVGRLGRDHFLGAIEPWHGNQVAVYRLKQHWDRTVIDDSLVDGHTILTADLNGDGNDEIVAGFRGGGHNVYIYYAEGGKWTRVPLDSGGMGAASCAAADLDSDGRTDIVCIGSATANLKWYRNLR
jgi:hypothetical protein